MEKTDEEATDDPHILVQRRFGLLDAIRTHADAIDEHVAICPECKEMIITCGFVSSLPKLRALMTVHVPGYQDWQRHTADKLKNLTRGQCLPCGCQVLDVAWTIDQARAKFYVALSEVLQVSVQDAEKVPDWTRLLELPLDTKSLRRLRDKFWLPDGSLGSAEGRDDEEGDKVRQLPETVREFITRILSVHSGLSYTECSDHWIS